MKARKQFVQGQANTQVKYAGEQQAKKERQAGSLVDRYANRRDGQDAKQSCKANKAGKQTRRQADIRQMKR